jgi:carbon monoxide dehydrogenase subunit G
MPETNKTFRVDAPADETWEYLTEMENFASHLPGFVRYEQEDETTSLWTVKIDLAMFSKELTFEVNVHEEEYPVAAFTLDPIDQPADAKGSVEFDAVDESTTEVQLHIDGEATGRMSPFLNKVIGKALENVSESFVENLENASIQAESG